MTMTHKYLWYLGLLIWNGLPDDTKLSSKHNFGKKIISMYTMGKFSP